MQQVAGLIVFDAEAVRRALTYEAAIPVVREAMIALSGGEVRQLLRSFIGLGEGRTFAIMPAALSEHGGFGAKLVSVFNDGTGRKAHEGLVVLFDGESGAPVCLADAGEVTAIRTAAASAVATDALARPDASILAVLGTGTQAEGHIRAIGLVRPLSEVRVWGRDPARTAAFARRLGATAFSDVRAAVAGADIVCTVTGAVDPILKGAWVALGAHVNVVGSSSPAQAEVGIELVARSRYIVDHREHVLVHGGEFLRAKAAGAIGDAHIAAEIGEVLAGRVPGRTFTDQVTVYKSLGHAVQDLAAVAWLYERAA
jgi:ornithine cyclodeaminase/alanine dehydrogenase-like protein (mu-crystallin family)